jgi:death on curing protein
MDEPTWVEEATVRGIHNRQLAEHGGLPGVREPGGLESALIRPHHVFAYSEPPPDLAALAAAYAGGIVRNHPFVDGNKRVAHVVARTFLRLNGWDLQAKAEEKYVAVLRLATREISEEGFAAWIRGHLEPWEPGVKGSQRSRRSDEG